MRWLLAVAAVAYGGGSPAPVVPLGDLAELHVCSAHILRVVYRPAASAGVPASLVAKTDWEPAEFAVTRTADYVLVQTDSILANFSMEQGTMSFMDAKTKKLIVQEAGHNFTKVQDMGRDTYQVEQAWQEASPKEGLYGGGSFQNGLVNFKNAPVELIQFNTEDIVPFFWSTAGYGILWDNTAWSYLNPPERALVQPGHSFQGTVSFTPAADGDYFFFVGKPFPAGGAAPAYGSGSDPHFVQVNVLDAGSQVTVVQKWDRMQNLPNSITGVASLSKGRTYTVAYSWDLPGVGLYVQGPEYGRTTLRSALGDVVDYYFVNAIGSGASKVGDLAIAGYREITGAAPLYAKWVFGFWQCKEHYASKAEVLAAAHAFRSRNIPVDSIVQDWLYWGSLGWGPQWDPATYPDPKGMVQELRGINMHFMVSVWSKLEAKTTFYKQMDAKGWLLGNSTYYDAWNPQARELFYNFSRDAHFSIGVDSLWLDATEPEDLPNVNAKTYLGSGNALMNSYPLLTTQAISDGLRRDFPEDQGARVFSLTRSAFAGQQKTGAALWSGDIAGTWDSLRRQISSSINYQMSGMPYWSEDIGGFFRPWDQYASPDYQELLTRWFQFGAFTPIFRVHGAGTKTEIWNFGDATMRDINVSAITLRYRLLPYTYSGFARVDRESYTMQRGLMMDFADEEDVTSIADQFMWGDALMVTPIYTPSSPLHWIRGGRSAGRRSAYFPTGAAGWVNFHTGASQASGHATVSFPVSEAPVFVRAGSVLVLGPAMQYTGQLQADPLEIRVYRGADAKFALFEDDGHSRAYQKGESTSIEFTWNESEQTLNIGAREGSFLGMLSSRTFNVVWVAPGHGVGVDAATADVSVPYAGQPVTVPFHDGGRGEPVDLRSLWS